MSWHLVSLNQAMYSIAEKRSTKDAQRIKVQDTERNDYCKENINLLVKGSWQTLRTIVSFGFKAARPPGGSRGAPVTNCRNARLSSHLNSCIISNNCNDKKDHKIFWRDVRWSNIYRLTAFHLETRLLRSCPRHTSLLKLFSMRWAFKKLSLMGDPSKTGALALMSTSPGFPVHSSNKPIVCRLQMKETVQRILTLLIGGLLAV